MTVIRDHAGLTDAWVEAHPQPASSVSGLNAVQVLDTFGVTADSPLNSYSAGKPLDPTARAELANVWTTSSTVTPFSRRSQDATSGMQGVARRPHRARSRL